MSACDFTLEHYQDILRTIQEKGYRDIFFNEATGNPKEILLRHDIDLDLESAYKMALVESRCGMRATYFIFVRSPFYNILDSANSNFMKEIASLGHQIGLHFDQAFYGTDDIEVLKNHVDAEVQLMVNCFDRDVFAVSFHRPSRLILESDIKLNNNLINTYDKSFTRNFKYISDSRRMWKDGCLCRLIEKADENGMSIPCIHALIHPVWWVETGINAQVTMEKFLLNKLKYLDDELQKNIQVYMKLYS